MNHLQPSSRFAKRTVLLTALLLAGALVALSERRSTSEISYKGEPLTRWLAGPISGQHTWDETRDAIRSASPEVAIPILLRNLRRRDSPLTQVHRSVWQMLPFRIQRRFTEPFPAYYYRAGAAGGLGQFGELGVEPLAQALRDDNVQVRMVAIEALGNLGGNALPALRDLAKMASGQTEEERAAALSELSRIAPGSGHVLETLRRGLSDDSPWVQIAACRALSKCDSSVDEIIRVLCRIAVKDQGVSASAAVRLLGNIGPRATSAVPILLDAQRAGNFGLRQFATNALLKIRGLTNISSLD